MCIESVISDFLSQWQTLIAGLIAATAAIGTVLLTLSSEQRRRNKEVWSLKIALGAEIRQFARRAYDAHMSIIGHLENNASMSVHQLNDDARFPAQVIYPNTASSLGMMGDAAHSVVTFYGQVNLMCDALKRIEKANDSIDRATAATLIDTLLDTCDKAAEILPTLIGTPRSEHDRKFILEVKEASTTWQTKRNNFFSPPPFKSGEWAE